jgi:hypothetical protein
MLSLPMASIIICCEQHLQNSLLCVGKVVYHIEILISTSLENILHPIYSAQAKAGPHLSVSPRWHKLYGAQAPDYQKKKKLLYKKPTSSLHIFQNFQFTAVDLR